MESRFTPQPTSPYTNQYGSSPGFQNPVLPEAGQVQQPPADFVSRDELHRILTARESAAAGEAALYNAHTVSRLEAERRFSDVFQNPDMKAAFDSAWRQDPFLKADPRGPEKLAATIRGLYYDPAAALTPPQVPAGVRKENLAGIGPSVPEGSGQVDPRVARFNAAFDYAKRTGRVDDMARAYRIAKGEE